MLSVGNRVLDSEYLKLHDIIDRIAHAIVSRNTAALSDAYELLERCLCACCALEKSIAKAVDLDFSERMQAHQCLLGRFDELKEELLAKSGCWLEWEVKYYIDTFRSYLIQHFRETAGALLLSAHHYDLDPSAVNAKCTGCQSDSAV